MNGIIRRHATGILVAVGLVLGCAIPIFAQGRGGPGPRGDSDDGPRFLDRWGDRLELTDEQRQSMRDFFQASQVEARATRKEMMRLQHELRGVMLQDEPDAKAAQGLIEKIGSLRTQQEIKRFAHRMSMRSMLTPEQREKLPMGLGMGHGRGWDDDPGWRDGSRGRRGDRDCGRCDGCDRDGSRRGGRHGGHHGGHHGGGWDDEL
jgi:Spy/CpxP family protein refolding chaperone